MNFSTNIPWATLKRLTCAISIPKLQCLRTLDWRSRWLRHIDWQDAWFGHCFQARNSFKSLYVLPRVSFNFTSDNLVNKTKTNSMREVSLSHLNLQSWSKDSLYFSCISYLFSQTFWTPKSPTPSLQDNVASTWQVAAYISTSSGWGGCVKNVVSLVDNCKCHVQRA